MNRRFDELDSLRGIAAITVLFAHLVSTSIGGAADLFNIFKNTPVQIFWAGHEAVILFFILSGFVLSLPYYNNSAPKYKEYLIKRICRIYLPYIVAIALAIFCINLFARMPIDGMNKWINSTWITPISNGSILNHVFFIGDFATFNINSVVWSLVHEMRISIIFPVIMFIVLKLNWIKNLSIALTCSATSIVTWYICIKYFETNLYQSTTSFLWTLHYIAFFIVGSLLAQNRQFIHNTYINLSKKIKFTAAVAGILVYTYSYWFFNDNPFLHYSVIDDWAIAIGSVVFIIISMNSKAVKFIMLTKPVHFVGKISYSMYLFHMIVILTMINVFYGKFPVNLILVASIPISFLVASLMYFIVEKPSITIGRYLTRKKKSEPKIPTGTIGETA